MDAEKAAAAARHKLELYRRYFKEGVTGPLAEIYAIEIVKLQAELDAIERGSKRR